MIHIYFEMNNGYSVYVGMLLYDTLEESYDTLLAIAKRDGFDKITERDSKQKSVNSWVVFIALFLVIITAASMIVPRTTVATVLQAAIVLIAILLAVKEEKR